MSTVDIAVTPVCSRDELKLSTLLPSPSDILELEKFISWSVGRFIFKYFGSIFSSIPKNDIEALLAENFPENSTAGFPDVLRTMDYDTDHFDRFKQTEIHPLDLLDKNENVTSEMEEGLSYWANESLGLDDSNFHAPKKMFHFGDQLTVVRMLGAMHRKGMMNPPENVRDLQHILAVHGDFHTHWAFIANAIFDPFWGSANQHYLSLSAIAMKLHRKKLNKDATIYYHSMEFLRHIFEGFIAAEAIKILRLRLDSPKFVAKTKISPTQKASFGNLDFFLQLTNGIVKSLRPTRSDSGALKMSKHLFKEIAISLYADNATNFENGYNAVRAQKFFLLRFLGSRAKNYSKETARHLTNVLCDYSIRDAFIAINNRTVNHSGIPGKGMALDMCEEHFINDLKKVVKHNPNLSFKHARECSLLAVYLSKISANFSKEIEVVRNNPFHTTSDHENDLDTICTYFLDMPPDATFVPAPVLVDKALDKLMKKNWMKTFLGRKARISYSINCHIGDDPPVHDNIDDTDENDDGEDYHRGEYHRLYDDDDNDDA
jgi:hypothetical protein